MDPGAQKQQITAIFDTIARGYDCAALRFFPLCAERLVSFANPDPGSTVLDVATGTGVVAVTAARHVGTQGRVFGIDLSEAMLEQTASKLRRLQLSHVDLQVMDAEALEFREEFFDAVLCSFGIFFLPDMVKGLQEWVRVTRPGGRVAFSCFSQPALQPMASRFMEQIQAFGVTWAVDGKLPTERLQTAQACGELLQAAGLDRIEIETVPIGYHLSGVDEWWEVCWNSGLRGLLQQLPADALAEFKSQHLQSVGSWMTDRGIWLNVETHLAVGAKTS